MYISIHDIAKVEIKNAPEAVENYFNWFLSPFIVSQTGKADLVIEMVDYIDIPNSASYISTGAIYDDSDIYYFDRYGHKFSTIFSDLDYGKACRVIAEKDVTPDSIYNNIIFPFIRYRVSSLGVALVHASAVELDGMGILFPAWARTGKTNILMHFLGNGGNYLGDDFVLINQEGSIFSYPKPINLYSYNFAEFPVLVRNLNTPRRCILFLSNITSGCSHAWSSALKKESNLKRLLALIESLASYPMTHVQMDIQRAFGKPSQALQIPISYTFFLARDQRDKIHITEGSPEDMAQKMARCLDAEFMHFQQLYRMFRFAFPDRKNNVIEYCARGEQQILEQAFGSGRTYNVTIPERLRSDRLYKAVMDLISDGHTT
jgi:hypothetical protein